jgi:hypothetical protein
MEKRLFEKQEPQVYICPQTNIPCDKEYCIKSCNIKSEKEAEEHINLIGDPVNLDFIIVPVMSTIVIAFVIILIIIFSLFFS